MRPPGGSETLKRFAAWRIASSLLFLLVLRGVGAQEPAPAGGAEALPQPEELVSMDVRNADLQDLLKRLAHTARLNLVVGPEVSGRVTVVLRDVPWEDVLRSILAVNAYGFVREGEILRIDTLQNLGTRTRTEVFELRYLAASDVRTLLEGLVSAQGKVQVFAPEGRPAFTYGGATERRGVETTRAGLSRVLTVTDVPERLDVIRSTLARLDVQPRQIRIEARLVETTLDFDRTLGIDWNVQAGASGAQRPTSWPFRAGQPTLSDFTLENFPSTGGTFTFGTLNATQMSAVLKLVETDDRAQTISSPQIDTVDNLEASILIGERFPIVTTNVNALTGLQTTELAGFENIGIQLLVIPRIVGDERISLIVHPAASELGELVGDLYPRVLTTEADTQVLLRDGETIVIGGLYRNREVRNTSRLPGLGRIPVLGAPFRNVKIQREPKSLLIFVTARIVPERGAVEDWVMGPPSGVGLDRLEIPSGSETRVFLPGEGAR
ncbi:MAG: hypothetical protein HY608_07505 [Planctomycetes bacterium]|nr:hypothetical protein [Planctomycetota bacterium]